MAIEAGAKNGIFPVDEITEELYDGPCEPGHYQIFEADEDAVRMNGRSPSIFPQLKPTVAVPASAGKHEDHRRGGRTSRSTRWLSVPARTADSRTCATAAQDPQGQKGRQRCQMYCDPGNAEHLTRNVSSRAIWIFSSMRAVRFPRRPADLVWAVTWAFWQSMNAVWRQRTATLSAEWGTTFQRSIWQTRRLPQHPRSQAGSADPKEVM